MPCYVVALLYVAQNLVLLRYVVVCYVTAIGCTGRARLFGAKVSHIVPS